MPESRHNPFEGVTDYFSELVRMRTLGIHGTDHAAEVVERTHASAWVPPTDILALGDDLVIRVELAGVDPADIDLRFTHGALTVSGARRSDTEGAGRVEFLTRERFYGEFRRVITLPDGTTADQIAAEFDDGLVEITVTDAVTPSLSTRIALADRSAGATSRRVPPEADRA